MAFRALLQTRGRMKRLATSVQHALARMTQPVSLGRGRGWRGGSPVVGRSEISLRGGCLRRSRLAGGRWHVACCVQPVCFSHK